MRLSLRRKVGVLLISLLILQLVGLSVANAAPASLPPSAGMPGPNYHVVRPGETLFAIGRLYGINPWWIARSNMIPNPNIIFVGQVLVICRPGPSPFPPGPYPTGPYQTGPCPSGACRPGPQPFPGGWNGGCATIYVVKHGDTLFSIGRTFGIAPWSIARANGLFNPNLIVTGQVLCIPAPGPLFVM